MNTAVQLRPIAAADLPRCDLLHGAPIEIRDGALGPVALFASGTLVAYRLRTRRRVRLYVFRTLDVAEPLAASVPGVRPRVQLLLDLHSAGRVRLALRLFAYLARAGGDPSALTDAFYLRIGSVLSGHLPGAKILRTFLSRDTHLTGASTCPEPPWTSQELAYPRDLLESPAPLDPSGAGGATP